jgi:hypothetical protein
VDLVFLCIVVATFIVLAAAATAPACHDAEDAKDDEAVSQEEEVEVISYGEEFPVCEIADYAGKHQ